MRSLTKGRSRMDFERSGYGGVQGLELMDMVDSGNAVKRGVRDFVGQKDRSS
jgi:hypothetical protein